MFLVQINDFFCDFLQKFKQVIWIKNLMRFYDGVRPTRRFAPPPPMSNRIQVMIKTRNLVISKKSNVSGSIE